MSKSRSTAHKLRTYHRLQLAAHLAKKAADRLVSQETGLTVTQVAVMAAIDDLDSPIQRDIADALGVNESAVIETLGRLRASGLVERSRAPEDPRAWVLALTHKGRNVLGRAGTAFAPVNEVIDQQLDDQRRTELTRDLARLVDAFSTLIQGT